jgi:hypothetical protein
MFTPAASVNAPPNPNRVWRTPVLLRENTTAKIKIQQKKTNQSQQKNHTCYCKQYKIQHYTIMYNEIIIFRRTFLKKKINRLFLWIIWSSKSTWKILTTGREFWWNCARGYFEAIAIFPRGVLYKHAFGQVWGWRDSVTECGTTYTHKRVTSFLLRTRFAIQQTCWQQTNIF